MTSPTHPAGAPEPSSRVMRVLEAYLAELERGRPPHPDELIRRHPDLADVLRDYLASLAFLHRAALSLHGRASAPETAAAEPPPELGQLGDFRLVREVGRGGMGIVYEAEQVSLRRRVALKILPFAVGLDGKQLQRFRNEAQAAAHLHHQHIVPVYYVGCEGGVHFYAMQFIEGQTLAAVIHELRRAAGLEGAGEAPARGPAPGLPVPASPPEPPAGPDVPPPPAETLRQEATGTLAAFGWELSTRSATYVRTVARLGVEAAGALAHAHETGVVHRDIRPANLLVDGRGHLWITDFGLAQCQGQAGPTLSGDIVGTLRYMSPEQAAGRRGVVDHRTDIYSLGVTLYELLTLEPAVPGREREEILQQIRVAEPRPPRRLNPALPADLETVVLKALAKEPGERYASAQELADDLRRFLEDKPVWARRPTLRQRAVKWARRHRGVVAAAFATLVLAVTALAIHSWLIARQLRVTEAQRGRATDNLALALDALDKVYLQVAEEQIPRTPVLGREQKELLRTTLGFYEAFIQKNETDPNARFMTAKACRRVGAIYRILEDPARVEETLQRGQALLEQLTDGLSGPREPRLELALMRSGLGTVLQTVGRYAEAEGALSRANDLLDRLVADFPDWHEARAYQAAGILDLGTLFDIESRHAEAAKLLRS